MAKKIFTSNDFSVTDLLYFGYSNFEASEILFKERKIHLLDSAGYLAHLWLELILKAWILHLKGKFEETHDVKKLLDQIKVEDPSVTLNEHQQKIFNHISCFETLRYPNCPQPSGIGEEDIVLIKELDEALWKLMPDELIDAYNNINMTRKGNRVLMVKPDHIPLNYDLELEQ